MNVRKILLAATAVLLTVSAFAQGDSKKYWFYGAGGGLNVGYNGNVFQDHHERQTSGKGSGFSGDVYIGRWFSGFLGARASVQGITTSDEYTNFGTYGLLYAHGDVLFRPWRAVVPYAHAGYFKVSNTERTKGKPAAGAGIMFPIPVSRWISVVPDLRYTFVDHEVFPNGSNIASNLSFTIGIAIKFGGAYRRNRLDDADGLTPAGSLDDITMVEPVQEIQPVPDTIYVQPDTVYVQPDLEQKSAEVTEFLSNITLFDFDKFNLTDEAKAGLDEVIAWMKKYPSVKIDLAGHTDDRGSVEYNQTLSENRCKSVASYLENGGIDSSRITYKGYGKSKPVTTNDTEEGRHRNRRVEVTFSE